MRLTDSIKVKEALHLPQDSISWESNQWSASSSSHFFLYAAESMRLSISDLFDAFTFMNHPASKGSWLTCVTWQHRITIDVGRKKGREARISNRKGVEVNANLAARKFLIVVVSESSCNSRQRHPCTHQTMSVAKDRASLNHTSQHIRDGHKALTVCSLL